MSLSRRNRGLEVFSAVAHLYRTDPTVLRAHPLYLTRELTVFGYFEEDDPPSIAGVEHAQDLIRELVK